MAKVWEPGKKEELLRRLESLRSDTRPKWGSFTASRMLEHCAAGMEMALGDLPVAPIKSPLGVWPMPKLVIYVLPWPKSAPTAPELLPKADPDFKQAKARFKKLLDRTITAREGGKFARHALFGQLSPADWGALMHRHIDHHWKQFGI